MPFSYLKQTKFYASTSFEDNITLFNDALLNQKKTKMNKSYSKDPLSGLS
jgi:hypothetical protein